MGHLDGNGWSAPAITQKGCGELGAPYSGNGLSAPANQSTPGDYVYNTGNGGTSYDWSMYLVGDGSIED